MWAPLWLVPSILFAIVVMVVLGVVIYHSWRRKEEARHDRMWRETDRKWRDIVAKAYRESAIPKNDFKYSRLNIDYSFLPDGSLESTVTAHIQPLRPLGRSACLYWFVPKTEGWKEVISPSAEVEGEAVIPQLKETETYTLVRVPIGFSVRSKKSVVVFFRFVVKSWAVNATPRLYGWLACKQEGLWRHFPVHDTDIFQVRFIFPADARVKSAFCTASDFSQTQLEGRAQYVLRETPFKGVCGGIFTYLKNYALFLWLLAISVAVLLTLITLTITFFYNEPVILISLLFVELLVFVYIGLSVMAYPHGT